MNILFIGYETECIALADLADQLEDSSHSVKLALGDYYNFIDDREIRKRIREGSFTNWTSIESEYKKLYDENKEVNWKYLKQFESQYCYNKNIIQIARTDQVLLRDHHFRRPYYKPSSPDSDLLYYWLELQLRWVENIFNEFNPDIVFTIGRNYLIKNAAAQIALSGNTPIRTLVKSRLGNYHHMTRNFGYGTEKRIEKYVDRPHDDEELEEAKAWCQRFREQEHFTSLYDARAQKRVQRDKLFTTEEVVKNLFGAVTRLAKKTVRRSKTKYRGLLRANYFNSHFPSVVRWQSRVAYNRLKYLYANPFEQSLPNNRFIYVPLHTLPESSTLTLSTEYYESDLIRFMSKELPAGVKIGVKENPNMVGMRPFKYYKKIDQLPNVCLLDPEIESKQLIQHCQGVAGISGTALLEAATLGKPTHAFGYPEFETVIDYHGHDEFDSFIHQCMSNSESQSIERAEKYIQFIINDGEELSLEPISNSPRSKEYWKNLDKIKKMFKKEISSLGT